MNILWSVNTVSPNVGKSLGIRSTHAISWVESMSKEIKQLHRLAIAAPGTGTELKKVENDGITYYVLPADCEKTDHWGRVIEDFRPEIIHTYGTEKCHNVQLIDNYADQLPIVISLQGIITAYQKYYYAGMSMWEILFNYTIGNFLLRNGIIRGKRNFARQAVYEQRMLRGVRYVEGRSDWDRAVSLDINPELKYYHCPRMIRSPFFDHQWMGEFCELHSILVHQADYPIKGLHIMLDALARLRRTYPDVKLYIAGKNHSVRDTWKKKLGKSGYVQFIERKIRQHGLQDHIVFTGMLDADSMAERLSRVHVCVIPSSIENAPNALAEAMVVGTPSVASYVGGNADMLNQGECGWLYRYDEPELLADRIRHIFEHPEEAQKKAAAAFRVARHRHNPMDLKFRLIGIYENIIQDFRTTTQNYAETQ